MYSRSISLRGWLTVVAAFVIGFGVAIFVPKGLIGMGFFTAAAEEALDANFGEFVKADLQISTEFFRLAQLGLSLCNLSAVVGGSECYPTPVRAYNIVANERRRHAESQTP